MYLLPSTEERGPHCHSPKTSTQIGEIARGGVKLHGWGVHNIHIYIEINSYHSKNGIIKSYHRITSSRLGSRPPPAAHAQSPSPTSHVRNKEAQKKTKRERERKGNPLCGHVWPCVQYQMPTSKWCMVAICCHVRIASLLDVFFGVRVPAVTLSLS